MKREQYIDDLSWYQAIRTHYINYESEFRYNLCNTDPNDQH